MSLACVDSQASFSRSAIKAIRDTYKLRCVICLTNARTSQCAHIIDSASAGEKQLRNAVKLGILPADYKRNAATNGMVQCPGCLSYFTQNFIVLSLPIPLLKYLEGYVKETPMARQKPLHEVFDLLVDALDGLSVELPDPKRILPYLGLYTIVTLNPDEVEECELPTIYLPDLSILRAGKFVKAPANVTATAKTAARIFNSLDIEYDSPQKNDTIPLSPQHPRFKEQRYWRLPVPAAAVFAALVARLHHDESECEDIRLATKIRDFLSLKHEYQWVPDVGNGPPGGSGPSGGGRRGGGGDDRGHPSRGGTRGSKRTNPAGEQGASSGSGQKKPRTTADSYKSW